MVREISLLPRQSANSLDDVASTRFLFYLFVLHCLVLNPSHQVAGPTEIGILADGTADPKIIATDLVGVLWILLIILWIVKLHNINITIAIDLVGVFWISILLHKVSLIWPGESSRARSHLASLAGHHLSKAGQGGQHFGELVITMYPKSLRFHTPLIMSTRIVKMITIFRLRSLPPNLTKTCPGALLLSPHGPNMVSCFLIKPLRGDVLMMRLVIHQWWTTGHRWNSGGEVQRGGNQGDGKVGGEWWSWWWCLAMITWRVMRN